MGYIEPGHGAKGRKIWLNTDADVDDMYKIYEGRKEIMLKNETQEDVEQPSAKRPCRSDNKSSAITTTPQAELLTQKMREVDEIVTKLSEKQSGNFTVEQLRAWAYLIQNIILLMTPQINLFFVTRIVLLKNKTLRTSPKKTKIELRSQCVDQLQKWHDLLSKVITQQRYDELWDKIMSDIEQL